MPTKSKTLTIRINAEVKRTAKMIANNDGRSLSNWVAHLIKTEVKNAYTEYDRVANSISDLNST